MSSKRQLQRQWIRQQAAAENRHRSKIEKALNAQLNDFTGYADANGLAITMQLLDSVVTPDPLQTVIQQLYITEGTRAGIAEQRSLNAQFGDEYQVQKAFSFFTNWLQEMTNFFYNFGMQAITRMTETTKDRIRQEVGKGIAAQESYPEIRDRLTQQIPELNKKRANVIARTETVSALSNARQIAANSLPFVMNKEWLAIHDKRTRHSHANMDGETVLLTQPYSNTGMYPGDPELPAKERIQCRCTEVYTPLRDANDRPIRK